MAKVQQKSEKITAFGGIFFVLDKFDSILSSVIDSHLGLRSTLIGYLENRDGNCNVRFKQAETHRRFFEMMSRSAFMSSVSMPRVRHNRHKQGLNLTLEKLSADFR